MSSKYKNFYHADIEDYIRKYFPKFSNLIKINTIPNNSSKISEVNRTIKNIISFRHDKSLNFGCKSNRAVNHNNLILIRPKSCPINEHQSNSLNIGYINCQSARGDKLKKFTN